MKLRLSCLLVLILASACAPSVGYGEIVAATSAEEPSPTSAAAPREVPLETHTGTGSGEFATSWPADQLGFFTFDCPKCSSNVIIDTDGGEHGLVNAIGAYKGTTWLNTDPDRPVTRVTVHANAPWTATIQDYRSLPTASVGQPASGKGDAVLRLPEGATHIHLTVKTRGSTALWVMSPEQHDLLVNQIGDLQVERNVRGPAYLRVDGYEASWTLTPS
ncbi:hypothetical protein ACGFMK_04595 [Amycolatopsis sp. NPDC049252]|uniref:hypothetical protein n=1 Tax=Amycolatopsis sp. NPDC049252 TaxID=3363933 RepID=UPI00371989F8